MVLFCGDQPLHLIQPIDDQAKITGRDAISHRTDRLSFTVPARLDLTVK